MANGLPIKALFLNIPLNQDSENQNPITFNPKEMKTEANEPINFGAYDSSNYDREDITPGLTKREHFAAMAMQGYCAHQDIGSRYIDKIDKAAKYAVMAADALIHALNSTTK